MRPSLSVRFGSEDMEGQKVNTFKFKYVWHAKNQAENLFPDGGKRGENKKFSIHAHLVSISELFNLPNFQKTRRHC